jgi:hypothetical protein
MGLIMRLIFDFSKKIGNVGNSGEVSSKNI